MNNRKFFAFIILCMLLFFAAMTGGSCFLDDDDDKNINTSSYIVTFDTDGGSYIASQTVEAGEKITRPDNPSKADNFFMGWYSAKGFSFLYDFSQPVSSNITLYAKWRDINDKTDSDNDGLTDSLEYTYGTDPFSPDTDNDGLTDYDELNWLNYNPLARYTNNNGIPDGDEDADNDGLTNIQEVNFGTNMTIPDTDGDGLTDYEEVITYHTNPLNPDTDGDGVNDGVEISIGSDPLTAETNFTTTITTNNISQENPKAVDISVEVNTPAKGAGTLMIKQADRYDNVLISPNIPGYLAAYTISADGDINSALINFTLGSEFEDINENFQPSIDWTGALDLKDAIVEMQIYSALTDGSIQQFRKAVRYVSPYYDSIDEGDGASKYVIQMAQGRIMGINSLIEYVAEYKLGDIRRDIEANVLNALDILDLFRDMDTKNDTLEKLAANIKKVYDAVKSLKLDLSENMPYYENYGQPLL